jgi:hypothetical protein
VVVNTYVILRRGGWRSPRDLQAAAARSRAELGSDLRWLRSYVMEEEDGALGTVCIYEATSPETIRDHASRSGLPADEIVRVADTVLGQPDPA